MRFLFVINYFNDVDHTAPLIQWLLKREHKVYLICLTQYRLESDQRIKLLNRYNNFHIFRFSAMPRTSGTSNQNTGTLSLLAKLFREAFFGLITAWLIIKFNRIDRCIFTWGRPRAKGFQRHLFRVAVLSDIPTICLPHGQNIYLNYDVNSHLRRLHKSGSNWPDFSPRNEFNIYVVQTTKHRQMHIDWGMSPTKVCAVGSLRFDPTWVLENHGLYDRFEPNARNKNDINIVFFLPHWRYNVDEFQTMCLIEAIAKIKDTFTIVKGHTRGDSVDETRFNSLKSYANLILSCEADSAPLIRWAEIVVNFGSSVAIDAVVLDTFVVNPVFLHDNTTVFDNSTVAINTHSIKESTKVIKQISNREISLPSKSDKDDFLCSEVYADSPPFEVPERYAEIIINGWKSTDQ